MQYRGMSSPRLPDSPSKRSGGMWGALTGTGNRKADAQAQGSRLTTLLVMLSVLLNITVVGILLVRCGGGEPGALQAHTPTVLAATPLTTTLDTASAELVSLQQRELASLKDTLNSVRAEKAEALSGQKAALAKAAQALDDKEDLARKVEELKSAASSAPITLAASVSGDCPCRQQTRLSRDDLALKGTKFDLTEHEFEWKCDRELTAPKGNQTFCPETATSEQYFQLTFFDRPGAGSQVAVRKGRPVSPTCVQLPPREYVWPQKHAVIPVAPGGDGVNWPNLRVATLRDLLVFNRGTPKNLYHFNASFYDYEQESIVSHAARYIPFDQKVRVMLDIGSGGGSLGLVLKRRYDVQVVSTVFADWPYCEYITERGNLCMYLDAMEAMPFAKFSYDVLHSSWVFHALYPKQLVHTFLEQNRILRPGGYMWLNGGWSLEQVATIEDLFLTQLGYTAIYNHKKPVVKPGKTKFDTIPFELEWEVIMVKPIRAEEKSCRVAQAAHNPETRGRS